MLEYKKEVCEEILSDEKWIKRQESLGKKVDLEDEKIDVAMSTKILEQSIRVVEGKPIYLTEEQWDWLYDYILCMHEPNLWCNYIANLGFESESEEDAATDDWWKSLIKYTALFEEDIDSFLETSMPSESFRCVGCNKELEMRHMRVSVQLSWDQKIDCISAFKDEIHWLKTDKPDEGWLLDSLDNWDCDSDRPKNPLPSDRKKILILLRNARRILEKTPGTATLFLDPYTTRILYDALESHYYDGEYDDYDDATQILEILDKDVFPQMEKPLCGSCAGEGICHICNDG